VTDEDGAAIAFDREELRDILGEDGEALESVLDTLSDLVMLRHVQIH